MEIDKNKIPRYARLIAELIEHTGASDENIDGLFKTRIGSLENAKEAGVNISDYECLEFYYGK